MLKVVKNADCTPTAALKSSTNKPAPSCRSQPYAATAAYSNNAQNSVLALRKRIEATKVLTEKRWLLEKLAVGSQQ